jgi:hypothetical protein
MSHQYFTLKNLHNHIKYDEWVQEEDKNVLNISWDYNNEKLDKLMNTEHRPLINNKLNMMWIEKLKEKSGWVKGEKLYVYLKSNSDGYFNVWYSKNKEEYGVSDLIIEPTGYVSRAYFNNYSTDQYKEDNIQYHFYMRTESIYNNFIADKK